MQKEISNDLTLITEAVTSVVEPVAIYLFGSYAYGTPNEDSDIDIYAVVPDSVVDTIELNAQIRYALFYKQRKPIDLLIGKRAHFEKRKYGLTLENIIANQGIKIYG
jgi:predicted nucleotidyltransferase